STIAANIETGIVGLGGPGLTLNNSSVIGNGRNGIGVTSDMVVVNNSIISNNGGTGISYSGSFSPLLTINNSTVSSNTGGGVDIRGSVFSSTPVNINNSTIVNNTSVAFDVSGGIRLHDDYGINLTINNSTISGNSANSGGGFYNEGVINTVTIRNTILANNTATSSGPDCLGTINNSDHNILGNTSDCTLTAGAGDQFNVDPLISAYPVGLSGYFTLLAGSPAIDGGDPATCLSTDQRGMTRPQGSACDVGAYESVASPGPTSFFGYLDG